MFCGIMCRLVCRVSKLADLWVSFDDLGTFGMDRDWDYLHNTPQ